LSAIAVTQGPGLIGSLLVGITYAKALSLAAGPPLIATNHVEGHIHSVLIEHPGVQFPAVALVVSGGHTHLFSVSSPGRYTLMGKTRDDAAGEAYDKVAKLLGFGYPGGPIIDRLAPFGNPEAVRFSSAKMKGNTLDFSFSGLKTAVLRWTEQNDIREEIAARRSKSTASVDEWRSLSSPKTLDLLASFQRTVIRELLNRATAAADDLRAASILIAGGVAANAGLRTAANYRTKFRFFFPGAGLSTDNAVMIAAAAFPKLERGEFASLDLKPQANLTLS
jgi:N6-L-threonylcarbamoyladenine synthase